MDPPPLDDFLLRSSFSFFAWAGRQSVRTGQFPDSGFRGRRGEHLNGSTTESENSQIPDSGFRRAPIGVCGATGEGFTEFPEEIMKGPDSEFP